MVSDQIPLAFAACKVSPSHLSKSTELSQDKNEMPPLTALTHFEFSPTLKPGHGLGQCWYAMGNESPWKPAAWYNCLSDSEAE